MRSDTATPFFLYLAYNAPHSPGQAPRALIDKYSHVPDARQRIYLAQVDSLDQNVGRLLDALSVAGVRDNTLIFFLSDHGGRGDKGASNEPFSGGKGSWREGGIRVPFIASWPARWPQGIRFDPMVSSLDIAATAAAMAQVSPSDAPPLDGVNLDAFVRGESTDVPHEGPSGANR